jgi:tetratricopeptide (TPR) repeat protein
MTAFRRSFALLALLFVAPLYAADGRAGEPGRNPAAAQALFEEAQQRVAVGDYEQACPKFRASYALDPGGGTLLNLADCLEKQGRTASAWSTYKDALVLAQRDGRKERVEYAQQHIQALESKLTYLTVEVPAASRVADLELEVDGTSLAAAAWGTALPVDQGEHVLRAQAPGYEPIEQRVSLGSSAGARQTLELPLLRPAPHTAEPAPAATASAAPAPMVAESQHPARTWGWITGGVGLAALGVGSYFGLQAYAHWDDRNEACKDGCTPEAKAAGDDASQAATLATIGVSAGVVLLGTAAALFFYSSDAEPAAEAGVGLSFSATERGASVAWGGRF